MIVKQSREIETRVIGSLISIGTYNNYKIQKSMIQLNEDLFYHAENKELYRIIKQRFDNKEPFDTVSMLDLVQKAKDQTFRAFTTSINDKYFSPTLLAKDIETLITLSNLRKQIIIARQALFDAEKEPIPSQSQRILTDSLKSIAEIHHQGLSDGETYKEITEKYLAGFYNDNHYVKTGIPQLDNALDGGVINKSMITIAADAGVGKTGFAIWLMHCLAQSLTDKQCLFFSLEMENFKIMQRHASVIAGKPFQKLNDDEQFNAIQELRKTETTVYDATRPDIDFIETTCRIKAMEKPLSVVVVDYLGLVQNKGQFERNDLRQSDITQRLASLAIELNCIVIALSQTNRNASSRAKDDRCPYPHDAADSSGSHRSSTLWIGIDRPELYSDDPCYRNRFVVKCRKNRYGDVFNLDMKFNNGTFEVAPYGYFNAPAPAKTPDDYLS